MVDDAQVSVGDAGGDAPEDAERPRYNRDVRPLLEASACGSCHSVTGVEMTYEWMSAPGTSWCRPELLSGRYERRWSCFETHARTQTGVAGTQGCGSDFYHRHGEPCFTEAERSTVLAWANGGYAE